MPQEQRSPGPSLMFQLPWEALPLVQEAMNRLEQALEAEQGTQTSLSAKKRFAQETIQGILGKLEAMSQTTQVWCIIGFDANEKLLLSLALHLFTLDLYACPPDEHRAKALIYCQQIRAWCAGIVLAEQ